MIKPIETHYNGYRFRSRLEARWAVFFDALGIKYQYELEGFDLGDAGWYLPDYYIPHWDVWIEIKPENYRDIDMRGYIDTMIKQARFIGASPENEKTLRSSFILYGSPWPGEYKLQGAFVNTPFAELETFGDVIFAECEKCGGVSYFFRNHSNRSLGWGKLGNHECGDHSRIPLIKGPRIMEAYTAARSARFEHGEKPTDLRNHL